MVGGRKLITNIVIDAHKNNMLAKEPQIVLCNI